MAPPPAAIDGAAVDLEAYIYAAGFVHAAWADTMLAVEPLPPLRLHALLVSRSPYLYQRLAAVAVHGPPYEIRVDNGDSNLTTATLSMALATLYGRAVDVGTPTLEDARGLIAAGSLLGLRDVAMAGYDALRALFSLDRLPALFAFALERPPTLTPALSPSPGLSSASTAPSSPALDGQTPARDAALLDNVDASYAGPYPPYTAPLLAALVEYTVGALPAEFVAQRAARVAAPDLVELLLSLPFALFKAVCESETLAVRSEKDRYSFARELVAERERRRRRAGQSRLEESVVLAFGGGKGGAEVIRKPATRKKVLWKASQ
ncbi:uncharacterized protein V1510DRAFT_367447 [Dipodascopsis tothii]|uniref:uncharacterized protein n=1 Tax=Dipodascopsis tothii TaxID=44089 RepID=UPI0034CF8781